MPQTLLAHHWFFQPRGGERVLAELAGMLPGAPILTAFAADDVVGWPDSIATLRPRVWPSRLQPLFRAAERTPALMPLLLPLLPWGMRRSFTGPLAAADRVIVSDAGLAKSLALETAAPVSVYLHSPMRHIWHDAGQTLARLPAVARPAADHVLARLRRIDHESAARATRWAANSRTTAARASASSTTATSSSWGSCRSVCGAGRGGRRPPGAARRSRAAGTVGWPWLSTPPGRREARAPSPPPYTRPSRTSRR